MLNKKALAATAAGEAIYIEDVFSTYLYSGTGATQSINNGIDLSGEGGMLWLKQRNLSGNHYQVDTARGNTKYLASNSTTSQMTFTDAVTAFNNNGFTLGADTAAGDINGSGYNMVSWTFRKAEKFFDVVTYTGDGNSTQTISHSLGSVPGSIIAKGTSSATDWPVYHRGLNGGTTPEQWYVRLNSTAAQTNAVDNWGDIAPTSTNFTVGGNNNVNGISYVAYLFAHDAGGFGDSGSDNVITCGSYTATGNDTINLGYEPQWILEKRVSGSGDDWEIADNMRGLSMTDFKVLAPNTSAAEVSYGGFRQPTATGYINTYWGSGTIIYIAIRRGPMKTPTTGTSVFEPLARSGTGAAATVTTTVRPDGVLQNWRSGGLGSASHFFYDRLRGVAKALFTDTTDAESTQTATGINAFNNLSYGIAGAGSMNNGSATYVDYIFTRAPGFFDIVCYTGNGTSGRTVTHNLGTKPQLIIVKCRNDVGHWYVYNETITATKYLAISLDNAAAAFTGAWNDTEPTSSVFSLGNVAAVNGGSNTFVAYLFASVAGVSKVGSYTGTGTTLQVNCGFTGGARFVMIKRTDSTGDWYVWDTARGIVSGNDPYLLLNSTAAEVTNTDYIDTYSQGFEISSTAPAAINANGGTFIFLAIA